MNLIYVSCPWGQREQLMQVCRSLMREGHLIAIPCRLRSQLMEWSRDSDTELLKVCGSIYMVDNWSTDPSCQREIRQALALHKQVFVEGKVEPA